MIQISDGTTPLAVEFFFPFRTMRCFASYDCTGQQLLDSGTVVMNGNGQRSTCRPPKVRTETVAGPLPFFACDENRCHGRNLRV